MNTSNTEYSPWQLLPAPEPRTVSPPPDYFYHNVAKHLVKDTVRIMSNGLPIDLDRVQELETTLDLQLDKVTADLADNLIVQQYLEQVHLADIQSYKLERQSHLKPISDFIKPFKPSDMVHRSYFMYLFANSQGFSQPSELLPSGIPKWPANLVKKLSSSYPVLKRLLEGTLNESHPLVVEAMNLLATHKADLYNSKYLTQITAPEVSYPTFNPSSSKDVTGIFKMLGIESETFSKKTGNPSFNREELERIQKEQSDPDILSLVNALLDHSSAAIIRNNFINSFYKYTVNGRLYGQYSLLGAKSGRYTSSNPNMLNAPSTGSVFAKPIKRCFIAPPGYVVWSIDYAALEDRVIASLTRDANKCGIFLQELDGHSLGAVSYFPDQVAAEMTLTGDIPTDAAEFKRLVDAGNQTLKALRQDGKAVTFGLSYGAFPPKIAATLKIPIEEAEKIFNNYHHKLYPDITRYREEYILPTAQTTGRIHLGLGFYLHTDNPDKDIRTLSNATCQFWSMLTALSINELHRRIDAAFADTSLIQVTSTIYDSIYGICVIDPNIISQLNSNLVEILTKDFMLDQAVPNVAEVEIGLNWADLHKLPHNASISDIQSVLDSL